MKLSKIPLLGRVVIAIILGIIIGQFAPIWFARIFATFNSLFGNFLSFIIPLIIIGLITPAIGELGHGAGKLLALTALIAYISTLFSGFFTFFSCQAVFPHVLTGAIDTGVLNGIEEVVIKPFFTIEMPPVMDVMPALILSFCIGLGITFLKGDILQKAFLEFREIITMIIKKIIIPFLPLYIFGMFLSMSISGQVYSVIVLFIKVILVIFILHILLLLMQFLIAGAISGRNPLKALKGMMPAYVTALGTSSSAATIPVTLQCAINNKVNPSIASFTIPLCATIHLAGSTMKITGFALAIQYFFGIPVDLPTFIGFIFMLGIIMIAAPGVPGGAIMAAVGILQSILGFNEQMIGLMITLYIAIDSFGTACNVTGDGAIALIMDKISRKSHQVA
ncbi:MAG: cation:dicarboxylase symporter family transporter [Bacteroidota bacterium]|jgi:Na+/H+-dicarboxylate symporter|nr:cation:dicarboxylase symporter family transporter [Bacteroidota bacterium]